MMTQAAILRALPAKLTGQVRSQHRNQVRKNIQQQTWVQEAATISQHTLTPESLQGDDGSCSRALGNSNSKGAEMCGTQCH